MYAKQQHSENWLDKQLIEQWIGNPDSRVSKPRLTMNF